MANPAPLLQSSLSYKLAQNQVERYFSLLYSNVMQYAPKAKSSNRYRGGKFDSNRPWVYFGTPGKMVAVATLSTLFKYLADPTKDTTYYTPNSYYRRDRRADDTARWIHAFALDIDVKGLYAHLKGITLADVLDRITNAGLPLPTSVIQTPSGGYQVTWFLAKPVRATQKVRRLYRIIQQYMADDVDADLQATGVQCIYRTPTEDNLVYFVPEHTYDFQVFVDWRDINHPPEDKRVYLAKDQAYIMDHPAIQQLLTQRAYPGIRDNTCLTLVLAMKYSGYSESQCEMMMLDWYSRCVEQGGKTPLTIRKVRNTVSRVYASRRLNRPSAKWIAELTGISFAFEGVSIYTTAKPRSKRKRIHLYESKQDLIQYLDKHQKITGSMQEIANLLGLAVSSLKRVVSECVKDGIIRVETKRGRNGYTTIMRSETTPDKPKRNVIPFPGNRRAKQNMESKIKRNTYQVHPIRGLKGMLFACCTYDSIKNSYTGITIDRGVGGLLPAGIRAGPGQYCRFEICQQLRYGVQSFCLLCYTGLAG